MIMIADLDKKIIDPEQIEYLQRFLEDYRAEVIQTIISFIVNVPNHGNGKATQARIVSRAALLDRLLNKREVTAREIPKIYGVSIHQYYDTLQEVEKELKENNSSIREVIRIK